MIIQGLILIAATIVNRFRGGGFWADKIPVKALWPATLMIGGLAYVMHGNWTPVYPYTGFWVPLAFMAAYIIWAIAPWGRWFDHGRMTLPDRDVTKYEVIIEEISVSVCHRLGIYNFRFIDMLSNFMRHLNLVPALAVIAFVTGNYLLIPLGIPLALVIVSFYETGWLLWENGKIDNPIEIAELLVGTLWGALIAFS